MPPRHISSGTIPKSTSRPTSRHTRSRGPPEDLAIEDIPEPPVAALPSEAPQESAGSQQRVASSRPGNEDVLEAAAKACTEITAPVAGRVNHLEKAIPSLLVTNEDAFARLAAMEALLDKAIQQPAEVVQDVVTLRSDVNRIHELNSVTARSLARIEQALAVRRDVQEALQEAGNTANDTSANAFDENLLSENNGDEHHDVRGDEPRSHSRRGSRSNSRHTRSQPRATPISGIRGHEDPDSSSSSSDDSMRNHNSERRGTGFTSSDDEFQIAIVPFHQRRKGPSHPGLASLQPSNRKYQRLMSYRYYRLRKTKQTRDHARTTQLHKLLKNLDLSFRESKFSGQDPILIFDFLTRMVEECDTLGMSEAQSFMALPHFLSDNARTQFRAMQSG